MLTIEEARRIQAKRQKTALTKFFVFLAVVLTVNMVGDILLVRFDADSRIIPLLAFLSAMLLMALFFRLGMQNFFKKKEVTGIVLSTQADALPTHSSKSHLAGQRYKTVDQPVLQIVLREETGPEKSKEKLFFTKKKSK